MIARASRIVASFLLAMAAATGSACRDSHADDKPAQRFEHDVLVRFHMHESYDLYGAIERLLIRGKLDDARDLARSIGRAPDEAGMAPFQTQSALVRTRAMAVADATTLDEATRRTATLAAACAGCHVDTNAVPELRTSPPVPADRHDVPSRMARHLWAIARVHEGMIAGVDEPWRSGLDVLAEAPLPWPSEDRARAQLAQRLHDVAARAKHRVSASSDDRAVSYGELLATCAGCHTTPGSPPRTP